MAGGATDWAVVALGRSHTCGLKRSGQLRCWGWDDHGQLGDDGAFADKHTPVPVAGATRWTAVAAGGYHTCARGTTGRLWASRTRLYCWGLDNVGQVGDGAALANQPLPAEVAGSGIGWVSVRAAEFHSCARTVIGRLFCWGHDSNGQLGDGGANTDQPTPVAIS